MNNLTNSDERPPERRRLRLPVDERRAQLVRVGQDLFQTYGYDEISIDEFARAAGVSKGLIYHYFSSKHDFFAAVKRANEREMERTSKAFDGTDAVEKLTGWKEMTR